MEDLAKILLLANCAVNIPLALASVIGNALVLHAVWKTPSLRSPSILLLCGLALSDLAVGAVVQPLFITHVLVKLFGSFAVENLVNNLYNTVAFSLCGISFFTIALISLDRLIAVVKPFKYPNIVTVPRVVFTLIGMWLLFSSIASMQVWAVNVLWSTVVLVVFCGFCISTISHVKIYRIVRQHQNAIQVQMQAVQVSVTNAINMTRLKKSAQNTFIVYLVLILCYSPYAVVGVTTFIYPSGRYLPRILVSTIVFMKSSLNPILYCWRSREIRVVVAQTCRPLVFWRRNVRRQIHPANQ